MKNRPIVITRAVRERIADIKAYAAKNIFTIDEMKKLLKTGCPAGDDKSNVMYIEEGFRIVYTQEEQHRPKGGYDVCHHISISVKEDGCYPGIQSVKFICGLFGITFPGIALWAEEEAEAINIIAPVNPSPEDVPMNLSDERDGAIIHLVQGDHTVCGVEPDDNQHRPGHGWVGQHNISLVTCPVCKRAKK